MGNDGSESMRCNRCGTIWPTVVADATDEGGAHPLACPACRSTDFGPVATAPLPRPNDVTFLHVQFMTPQPPPVPGTFIEMGPYVMFPPESRGSTQDATPAQWAQDPTGRNELRWWNGV